ncbi:MAG TPA: CAP domain-containing protein [Anaerolineales bacterium]|nr:CAP domain-containing protein [Anaerolineales bacterium]
MTPSPTDTAAPPSATATPGCNASGNTAFESTLLGLINDERNNEGLSAYASQSQLRAAARIHSADMSCNGFVSHTGSDGSSVRDRVQRQGYTWSWIGENIYCTSDTSSAAPQRVFDWWMNSAPHHANLMSPNYTQIGMGYMYANGRGCFTADFARPG